MGIWENVEQLGRNDVAGALKVYRSVPYPHPDVTRALLRLQDDHTELEGAMVTLDQLRRPSFFKHASRETALDSMLAYIFEVATPHHSGHHLHELGRRMLQVFVGDDLEIRHVRPWTQKGGKAPGMRRRVIDLVVGLNDLWGGPVLVVENKVHSKIGLSQLRGHEALAERKWGRHGRPLVFRVVKLASAEEMVPEPWGRLGAEDLLSAFEGLEVQDVLVNQWKTHLRTFL